jgi:MFS transporter, Spinster family, sphingosine-1-phosphate transporter
MRESLNLSRKAAYYGLGIVTLLNLLNYIDRFILAAVLPRIQSELFLTNSQAGFLATAFLITYFLTSPVFGVLGDRFSRTRLMSIGVAVWSAATVATGMMRNFVQILLARSSVGVGEAAYAAISAALLSDYFPPKQRGRAFSVFYVAIPLGAAAGYLLGGLIDSLWGWRAAFYVVGLPGIAAAALALSAPDPPRGASEEKIVSAEAPPVAAALAGLGSNLRYVGTVLGYVAYTFALGGLQLWMPKFLNQVRGLDLARADFMMGVLTVIAGLGGTFAGGYLGDVLSGRMKHGQLWLCGASSLAGIVPMWLALTIPSAPAYWIWLFTAEFLLFLSTGPVNVAIVNIVPVGVRALAMSMSTFAIHLLGDAISPPIVGLLADRNGLAQAVLIMPAAIAVSGLIWAGTAAMRISGAPKHSTSDFHR